MADECLLRQAVDRAWTLYRAAHNTMFMSWMNAGAARATSAARREARENDPQELICAGLAYLERVLSEVPVSE